MKTTPIITISNPPAAIPATLEQLTALGVTPEEIAAGEKRFVMEQRGPWGLVSSITAIIEMAEYEANGAPENWKAFYTARRCSNPRESGYSQEGSISLGGVRRHVFTSSQLFELPDGRLIDVATLHTCSR